MKLYEYTVELFKNGPELWSDETFTTNKKGVTIRKDTKRLRACSMGLITCNNAEEWYRICRLNCEPGTVIEEYDEALWKPLFDDMLALVRVELTKSLLEERGMKSAKPLLDILARRDTEHWDKQQQSSVEVKQGDQVVTFKFEGMK